jgi:hypothetical protein
MSQEAFGLDLQVINMDVLLILSAKLISGMWGLPDVYN